MNMKIDVISLLKNKTNVLAVIIGLLLVFFVSPYTVLYWFILSTLTFLVFISFLQSTEKIEKSILLGVILLITITLLIISFFSSPIFNAKEYASLIKPKDIRYREYFINDLSKVRKVTEKMALTKANKIFGRKINNVDLTTQYEIGRGSIIKYHNHEYWLFPLYYGGFFKWLANPNVKGYILVDAINPNATPKFVKYEYKYSLGAFFLSRNPYYKIYAYSRFRPVKIHPELDEKGNLYWIGEVLKYKYIGHVFYVDKIVILNAKTSEIKEYKPNNVPKWVDKIYPQEIIQDYIEYYGKYKNGFLNALFIGKNVTVPTLYKNKELYLIQNVKSPNLTWYTGMTSVNAKDNALLYGIAIDAKTLKAYKIEDLNGITDENGAINAVESKLGANAIRWKATIPMPIIYNNKFYYHLSIVDKKTNLYIKSALINGYNISDVKFIDLKNKNNQTNKIINKKDKIKRLIEKIGKIQKELEEIKIELKELDYSHK